MFKLLKYLLRVSPLKQISEISKRLRLPGFDGLPLYDVLSFFVKRLNEGELQVRARSLAFSFLLALFPAIIFIFTLIPYIPIEHFQDRMLALIQTLNLMFDPMITAINVMGNGAFAILFNKIYHCTKRSPSPI